jgi:acyl-coenzyme A thioesterase PaaI-like protein
MATSEYDAHIAVTRTARGDTVQTFGAELDAGWIVGGGVNGGYLLATLGNAIRASVPGKPDPLSISAYYLSASVPGEARVTTEVKRDGGSVATVAAELWQGDQARITALATYGDLSALPDGPGDVATTAAELDLPPREECVPNTMAPGDVRRIAPMMDRFEMLFHPEHVGWAVGEPSGKGVISAWFRLKDGREPDPISLLTVVDLLPPVTFDLGRPGWAPTLELTAHIRAVPAEGWLKVRHATRNVAGGMFEEDCEVWDSAGRLVAQSRQLARLPR